MFKKILILNRGEIAVRIVRTCREMGIRTVVVFSEADRTAMHVLLADEAFGMRGNTPSETYLQMDLAIDIAKRAGVDAIHPGYGFLSENPEFADRVGKAGITFIGPSLASIRMLGDKVAARKKAATLGIPTVLGTGEALRDLQDAEKAADTVGYPVLLKAAAGGGGKGMRVVGRAGDLASAFAAAQSEAQNAFGDNRVYVERLLKHPRHIEIQILADSQGNTVYMGERECSVQRRHQKLIEESPSTIVDESLRKRMGDAAVQLAKSAGYVNAGTVEFLVDAQRQFYFLEVNTRLQVEHPVTETLTGIDLVRQQILIAAGEQLPFTQDQIQRRGHAIECRICAEDPQNQFFPSTGVLTEYRLPNGPRVRVDNGYKQGDSIPVFYDSLMAKVITWGENRSEAVVTMRRVLSEFSVQGVKSTIPFCMFVLNNGAFLKGEFDTGFVDSEFDPAKFNGATPSNEVAAIVAAVLFQTGARQKSDRSTNHVNAQNSQWKRSRLETYH